VDVHARKLVTNPGAWIALLFVALGLPFLRLPGLHVDAASELTCFYACSQPAYSAKWFGGEIPLMILPYLGALKGWLYQPLLAMLRVTSFTVRLPLLLVAAGSVWIFFAILDRTVSRGAAIAGAVLLATDSSFLILSAIDFGPIVFLHFFLLAGLLLLLHGRIAPAFFLFGLATWHKALFAWMLVGVAVAALALFRRKLPFRRLPIAVAAFCLGAAPLIYYNVATAGATLRTREIMSANAPLTQKLVVMRKTMDGSALETLLTTNDRGDKDGMFLAFLAGIALTAWFRSRAALFALICAVVIFAQMAAIPNTGAAMHHSILVWPWPHFLIAVAGAQLPRRLGVPLLVLIAGSNLLLAGRYYTQIERGQLAPIFTDAVNPLAEYLQSGGAKHVATVDWGYGDTLCLLSDGDLNLEDLSFALSSGADPLRVRNLIEERGTVFVGRAPGDEVFPGVHARLAQTAAEMGYQRQLLTVVDDRYGHPRFEVFRYARAKPASDR